MAWGQGRDPTPRLEEGKGKAVYGSTETRIQYYYPALQPRCLVSCCTGVFSAWTSAPLVAEGPKANRDRPAASPEKITEQGKPGERK